MILAVAFVRHYTFVDTRIYLGAVRSWIAGNPLYAYAAPGSGLGFTYPPFAALVMAPFAWLPAGVMGWGSLLVSVAALTFVLGIVLRPVADRYGWNRGRTVAIALPIALLSEPVRQTLGMGQVDLVLFALITADLLAIRRAARVANGGAPVRTPAGDGAVRRRWNAGTWAGVGIGLAAAFKLTPALFIVYLLVTGQRRAARTAIVTAAAATLATALLVPRTTLQYFGATLWQTDRVGRTDVSENQSLAGLLARLTDTPHAPALAWVLVALAALVLGLARARQAHVNGDELAAFTLVGLTAGLISPVSWTHHMTFLLPAVVILMDTAWRRRLAGAPPRVVRLRLVGASAVLLLTIASPFWFVLHRLPATSHYADGWPGVVAENAITLLLAVLVVALPHRLGMDLTARNSPAPPPARLVDARDGG
ncbi:glycosyltransferase 87 family protein [Krasilnikovia cinnamomea]|uniref:glycosyltransferase 87 family protein n=1 Tax=Krasilnikovia cinnamomea TaxID=349313 RepID=UPI001F5EF45A|nr:glycosyltransferase 87 family protein [Krasilnikovia cinnamomea]